MRARAWPSWNCDRQAPALNALQADPCPDLFALALRHEPPPGVDPRHTDRWLGERGKCQSTSSQPRARRPGGRKPPSISSIWWTPLASRLFSLLRRISRTVAACPLDPAVTARPAPHPGSDCTDVPAASLACWQGLRPQRCCSSQHDLTAKRPFSQTTSSCQARIPTLLPHTSAAPQAAAMPGLMQKSGATSLTGAGGLDGKALHRQTVPAAAVCAGPQPVSALPHLAAQCFAQAARQVESKPQPLS